MSQNFNKRLRFFIAYVALPLALAKLLWSGALFFLSKESVAKQKNSSSYSYHYSLNLANKFIGEKIDLPPVTPDIDDGQRLDNIRLKGTYLGGDASFIIIEDGIESKFIYIGEKFRGYDLVKVGERKVVFEKNGKNYYVLLDDDEEKASSSNQNDIAHNEPVHESREGDGPVSITRDEMNSYIKNPDKIWKNVRIQEIRKNGILNGFRVNYVKRGSFFDKAGLKSGDVIKAIDGQEIRSLGDVMKYYTNANALDSLTLTVDRDGNEIDLDFSVN